MLAARRITRCNTCSVTLLNTLFSACGAGVRLPVPPRALTSANAATARLGHAGLLGTARGFHYAAAVRAAPPPPVDEIIEEAFESVTETVTELFEAEAETGPEGGKGAGKGAGEVIGAVTESVVHNVTIERRTVRKEQKQEDETGTAAEETAVREEEGAVVVEGDDAAPGAAASSPQAQGQAVPWFLRVETPRPASHPLAERQALPALPPTPPTALEPLLAHISAELGIGDLAIMDLRTMDPPPAIGPDTIMVLGNARSERHLHTSADKLCRWLRSEWRMRPDADGLLGRGELKIKNRRLKKKGKLVNAQTGQEEGVGWICVNAGAQGLVVQLFTQHRRGEIDLEGLWGKYLGVNAITRSPRATDADEAYNERKKRELEREEEEEEEEEDAEIRYNPRVPLIRLGAGLSTGSDFTPARARARTRPPHSRALHTSAPRRTLTLTPTPTPTPTPTLTPTDPANPRSTYLIDNIAFKGIEVPRSVAQGKPWHLTKQLPPTYTPAAHPAVATLIARAQINQLRAQFPGRKAAGSRTGPCTLLGTGPADTSSTEFLRSFHANLPPPPPPHASSSPAATQLRLELLIEAHRIAPAAYPAQCITDFLANLAQHMTPPHELYYLAVRALSTSPTLRAHDIGADADLTALDALTAQLRAHHPTADTTAPEYALCRLRALAPPAMPLVHDLALTVCDPAIETPTHAVRKRAGKLRMGRYRLDARVHALDAAVRAGRHGYTVREWHETLLTTYAMCGAWRAFWNAWGRMALLGVRRDEGLYRLVVGLVVMAGVQKEGVVAGRGLVRGMGREVPPVGVGVGMARGLITLVDLVEGVEAEGVEGVEGKGEKDAREGKREGRKGEKGEWKVLREKCERVIRRGAQAQAATS
ncbi:uncharacterized protein H6S33_009100 [Morchella sextelata]|uniref:uncharacterized protein n=1 Tax=Morchella sextelata TaxID=1174677 RepID=UPI001D03686A|nr:uncharacterized protein H6S33_009100 [Morchella sextelata]KAH0612720.1 hypothetical protein H6S33_009100 [Morchella sextelata]